MSLAYFNSGNIELTSDFASYPIIKNRKQELIENLAVESEIKKHALVPPLTQKNLRINNPKWCAINRKKSL